MSIYSASLKSHHPSSPVSSAGYSSWGTLSTAGVPPTPGTPIHSTIPLPPCCPANTQLHPAFQKQYNLREHPSADPSLSQDATYPATNALRVSLVPSHPTLSPVSIPIASRTGARLTVYDVLYELSAALTRPVDQTNPNALTHAASAAFHARTLGTEAYRQGMILADSMAGAWTVIGVRMSGNGTFEVRLA